MRFLYVNIPASGHVNPSLPLVSELVVRGHEVHYLCTPRYQKQIEQAGAYFHPYPQVTIKESDFDFKDFVKIGCQIQQWSMEIAEQSLPHIQKMGIDCIIHDSTCPLGKYLARIIQVPAVTVSTTLLFSPRVVMGTPLMIHAVWGIVRNFSYLWSMRKKQRSFLKRHNLSPISIADTFLCAEPLTIVCTSREIQPHDDGYDETHHFVGAMVRKEHAPFYYTSKRPLIYISLGTIHHGSLDFYRYCIDALCDELCEVVIAIGPTIEPSLLGPLPAHIHLYTFVPQIAVLEKASLFITHAGANSMHEALYHGVPTICVPQQSEQVFNATRIAQLGCGYILPKQASPSKLQSFVHTLLHDATIKSNLARISVSLRAAGGASHAAEAILKYLHSSVYTHLFNPV
jgi:MGT family glycosyltransferase